MSPARPPVMASTPTLLGRLPLLPHVTNPRETEGLLFSCCNLKNSTRSLHSLGYSDEPKGNLKAPGNPATQVRIARCAHAGFVPSPRA